MTMSGPSGTEAASPDSESSLSPQAAAVSANAPSSATAAKVLRVFMLVPPV